MYLFEFVGAMTEAFAQAYGPKVRVNCIMPGPFLTDISKAWDVEGFTAFVELNAHPILMSSIEQGLSQLGGYLLDRMVDRGMIFDPDHMSATAQRRALDLIEHDQWKGAGVLGPEAFDPLPFMDKMAEYGFPYEIKEM